MTAQLQDLATLQTLNHFSLSSLFTQGDADVRGQSDQADALVLTGGESYSYSCGWSGAILSEPTGGGRMSVSVSGEGREGVRANEERRFCFTLLLSVTYQSSVFKLKAHSLYLHLKLSKT